MTIVKISPKGQVTIPKMYRDKIRAIYYAFVVEGPDIVLKPIAFNNFPTNKKSKREFLKDFGQLSQKSLDFWNDPKDDIYQQFYK